MATGNPMWSITETQRVEAFAFSPGGDLIAVGFAKGLLRVYDAQTGEALRFKRGERSSADAADRSLSRREMEADIDDDPIMNVSGKPPSISARAHRCVDACNFECGGT
ncbi:hypothetical protein CONPUDRAFT_74950 [Coniophora puteana RWD-64-598 SS2]|uniref:Anaphase-promoting complex subunit 4-like WD40 domain-containing protein n=1 Tax=Coniophora puteana (strain RWD-64-598) TaxID=741705 RepID=A0A5M3MGS7_CONPW|nr:uncharacterized protein CONPUDRAFT_74950 [Coniophora puteana RWD-64-598 SS2]EIW78206.1 hypothetical protein CONPUDRAFT_74950 [Coniophora puteana RWD-64-598 SS2]